MTTGQRPLQRRWPGSGAIACIVAELLAIGSATAIAKGGEVDPPQGKIVALGFQPSSQTLLKAYGRAVLRSDNSGRGWVSIAFPATVARGRIASVAGAAHRQDVLYVAGPGFGVLRSEDGGRSWVARNTGLPSLDVVTLTAHAEATDTIYAYIPKKGIFRSEDAGAHWRLMDAGPRERISQLIHSNMPGSMKTGWFFAATPNGVDRSMDCFCGWRDAGALGQRVSAVAYDPHEPKRVYAATADALFVSADGGERWSRAASPGQAITALIVTPAGLLYAAVGEGELFESVDHGSTWRHIDA